MPVHPLPENPSYEQLKKQAKALRDAARAGDAAALARLGEHHPRAAEVLAEGGTVALADAQLALARGYGFAGWPRLKRHLEAVAAFEWDPFAERPAPVAASERFVKLACLVYGDWEPARVERALALLAEQPELVRADVWTAAAAGDARVLRELLARDPGLARRRGGALGWEPLLYACYSRVPPAAERSTLAAARVLLEHGAEPNAGFLWRGNVPPFTALTGVFGDGEDGNNQPPHPERDALAHLLLQAGADPNDGQVLYNCHFRRDDTHLELLFAYGLGTPRPSPWVERLGERVDAPQRLLVEELWSAVRKGYTGRVRLLLAHGVDVNLPGRRDGRTALEAALMTGHREIAELLRRHGAREVALDPVEAFAALCLAGDAAGARAALARDPGLLDRLGPQGQVELLHRAVEADQRAALRLCAALGFPISGTTIHRGVGSQRETTPLHNAAWAGNVELARLLLELGADPAARDPRFHATPLGWAHHNRQEAMAAFLMPHADLVDAVGCDGVERVDQILRADPSAVATRTPEGQPLVFALHPGMRRLAAMVAVLRSHGADFAARDDRGRSLVERAAASGDPAFADALRRAGAPPPAQEEFR